MDLSVSPAVAVFVTLGSMAIGARGLRVQKGTTADGKPAAALVYGGPINAIVAGLDDAINSLTGGGALYTVSDPTKADPRLAATTMNAQGTVVPKYVDESGGNKMLPSFIFWCILPFVFSYLGTILPICAFAPPVNYIGIWLTLL